MMLFITYLLKVFICSGVLYGYYTLALKNNTFHHWNRYYLLLSALLSLVLPLLQIPVSFYPQTGSDNLFPTQFITLRESIIQGGQSVRHIATPALLTIAGYALVTVFLLIRLLLNWRKIHTLLRNSRINAVAGYRLVENQQIQSPFSFFNHIFWSGDIPKESLEGQQILRHELAHVNGHHTTDKLLIEIVCSICWINPFFHLLKQELNMVHEFIADKAAAEPDDVADYAKTILLITLQSRMPGSINNFAQKPVKRRIHMLFNNKKNYPFMKKIIILPVLTALVIFISCQQKNETTVPSLSQLQKNQVNANTPDTTVYKFVEEPPVFPGGEEALAAFLSSNIHYPKNAQERNISGTVYIQFQVSSEGTIKDAKIVGPFHGGGLEEESIRVMNKMPKWIPGKIKGKRVSVMFNLPIRYTLQS
jgi:TonB family protein